MNNISFWLLCNLLLWLSYYIQKPTIKDFGRINNVNLQYYMLMFATLAYIANFVHIYMLKNTDEDHYIKLAIFAYYLLQIFFIPAVRSKKGQTKVKLLLLLACLPIYYLVSISFTRMKKIEIMLGTFVLLHVFINDFLLFGHMF